MPSARAVIGDRTGSAGVGTTVLGSTCIGSFCLRSAKCNAVSEVPLTPCNRNMGSSGTVTLTASAVVGSSSSPPSSDIELTGGRRDCFMSSGCGVADRADFGFKVNPKAGEFKKAGMSMLWDGRFGTAVVVVGSSLLQALINLVPSKT